MSSTTVAPLRVWVCGSAPVCDVILTGAGIAARHCVLTQYPTGYALEDLGSPFGTFVNGKRLGAREPEWVDASDAIVLGSSVRLPWPVASRSSVRAASPAGTVTIGRAPESDVVLDYPMISWNHARLRREAGRLILEDLGSTNGTAVGQTSNRITQADVQPTDVIFFGSLKVPVSRLLESKKLVLGEANQETVRMTGTEMIIGRDPDCDYPLKFPVISWRHARLEKTPNGLVIEDLGSKNGTFVDGQQISGRVALKQGSEIGLGSFRFKLLDDAGVLAKRSYQGNVTVAASQLVVEIQRGSVRRRLLDPVSLTVFPSELVALMGPGGRRQDDAAQGAQRLHAAQRRPGALQRRGSLRQSGAVPAADRLRPAGRHPAPAAHRQGSALLHGEAAHRPSRQRDRRRAFSRSCRI